MANYTRDVHVYDGTFKNEWKNTLNLTIEEKKHLFDLLMELLNDDNAKKGLALIKRDIGTPQNFDPSNNICADDVLGHICYEMFCDKYSNKEKAEIYSILSKVTPSYKLIYEYINGNSMDLKKTLLMMLNEQLSDMYLLGTCVSGRCSRLWQIYKFLG